MSQVLLKEAYSSLIPSTLHTIVHTRNTMSPTVIVIDDALNQYIVPAAIDILNATTVRISLTVAAAIRGTIS